MDCSATAIVVAVSRTTNHQQSLLILLNLLGKNYYRLEIRFLLYTAVRCWDVDKSIPYYNGSFIASIHFLLKQ